MRPSLDDTLSAERQQRVITETHRHIRRASELCGFQQADVTISFDLRGRAAGMYRVKKKLFHQDRTIRYNPTIFSMYFDDNLENTVPHEVAHYACDIIYGLGTIKPHGEEWKRVMQALGADPKVTADYDISGIQQRKLTTYPYRCDCGVQQLSSIRHNRVVRKKYRYQCRTCRQTLVGM